MIRSKTALRRAASSAPDWLPLTTPPHKALLEENRKLHERLRLEIMITSLSTHFINIPADRIDAGILYAMRVLGKWAETDRMSILQFEADGDSLERTHAWSVKDLELAPLPRRVDLRRLPWLRERMRGLHAVHLPNIAALPPEAAAEHKAWEAWGTRSMLAVPLVYRGNARGYLILETVRGEKTWSKIHVSTLRVAGEFLINATERKKTDQERKLMEERVLHDALHDALTGLPNRVFFLERVGRALERAARLPGEFCAVLLLDLDRFRRINDIMGQARGNLLLVELAQRFARQLPVGATLARLGGDEFGFLLEDVGGLDPATALAERLLKEMGEPLNVEGQEIYASGSIGIALGTDAYKTPGEILRDADTALDRAKGSGKGGHTVFDTSMHAKAVHLLRLETDLRKAMERREFFLHYQPIVDLKNRRLMGFEALVRWKQPSKPEMVSPVDFIPVAEETGLIVPLGKWVVEEAARQLRQWQDRFRGEPLLTMSVNISGKQFENGRLAEEIRQACADAGILPSTLKLEITESALMGNPEAAAVVLQELRASGFQLSLDDFGTGYSSLSYLHRFPFNTLKIDRSFVTRLEAGNKEDEIVRVINAMAGTLGMDVVAEGIESPSQLGHLLRHGVGFGQGYYFSRPLDVQSADRTLRAPETLWSGMAKTA